MELRHLTTFLTVIEAGSFLRAAAALDCAQSTVTLHIQQLEASLGVELFARDGRRVRLTEAGGELRDQARQILDQVAAARQTMVDLDKGAAGQVRLGAIEPTASLRLPPIIVRFCRERPKVRLTLEVGGTRATSERVASGHLDLGLCSPPPARLGLIFEPLFVEPLALLVPETHPLASAAEVGVADLRGQRLILTEPGCAYRDEIERVLLGRGTNPYSGLEIGSLEALKRAVAIGLGPAILPEAAVDPPPVGTVRRELAGVDLGLTVGLARRSDGGAPGRATEALIAALRSHLRSHPMQHWSLTL